MWKRLFGGKLKRAGWFLFAAYVLLFSSLFINNAVALIFILPAGVLSILLGIALWVSCVFQDAKQKDLL